MAILIYIPSWDDSYSRLSEIIERWWKEAFAQTPYIEVLSNTEFTGRPPIKVQEFDSMEIFICRGDKEKLENVRNELDILLMKNTDGYLPSDNPNFYRFAKIITE